MFCQWKLSSVKKKNSGRCKTFVKTIHVMQPLLGLIFLLHEQGIQEWTSKVCGRKSLKNKKSL